jgi:hypothetical protein
MIIKHKLLLISGVIVLITAVALVSRNQTTSDTTAKNQLNLTQGKENNIGDQNKLILDSDVCGQFTKGFIENATGLSFAGTLSYNRSMEDSCQYYTSKGTSDFVSLNIAYLNVEDQKKGLTYLDNILKTDNRIKMEHFIAINEKGVINGIYLILNKNSFIRLDRSSKSILSEDNMLQYAIKVADKVLALTP